ncbi:DinB family protein [Pedobacter sp. KBS0701]|uniref:DinB family protein n=1 Tax=Pedobacter sp. KBS0701 TaxID=2578106 RepID=UPI00110DFEA2|nr:DinB family protein [Pedobacter sp. KBS0701]QDW23328.1 DinB family protein [Pedobacter sp. KBS0701]
MAQQLEVWQRGPLPEIIPMLQPVAHALLQAREEINEYMVEFPIELLWQRPAGMASTGFHLQHLSGVLDRVFTYARAESLSEFQFAQLAEEGKDSAAGYTVADLVNRFNKQVDLALAQIKSTDAITLPDYRGVGRAGLPSTVIGLLFHAAEHTMRHVGQLMVTVAVVKNYKEV